MRQASSFSLHRIAAVFVDSPPTLTFAMSSFPRPPFREGRGSRGRRSFSNRTPSISGDSHFQSLYDAHSNFRRNNDFRPIINNCQSLNSSSNSDAGGNYSYRGRNSRFNQRTNQLPGVKFQRPKPADYRTWEFAKVPPPNAERFVVLSYNILADYLANNHRKLYFHIPRRFMSWEWRKGNILFELRLWSPDIICFQEVDRFHDLEEDLRVRGYSGIWKMRTGDPIDGCAIFWRTTRFKLMYEECIEFNKHGMRDNVAQICVLESLLPNHKRDRLASSLSSEGSNRVVICNIHVLYNPRRGEIKLGQVRILLEKAQAVSKMWEDAPVVLCGDFNCTPKSPLYNFISEQKLDISEVDRDKVSGQASAEIQPPPRQYGPQFREQPTRNMAIPTTVQYNNIDTSQHHLLENENEGQSIIENNQTPVSLENSSVVSMLSVPVTSFKENRGLNELSDNLNSQGHLAELNKDENPSAKVAETNETLRGPENAISSSLTLKEKMKGILTTEDSSTHNGDRLSSVRHDFGRNNVEKDGNNSNLSHLDNIQTHSSESDEENMLEDEGDLGEDAEDCLSEISNCRDAFPPNLGDVVPEHETVDVDKPYDPSLWTPLEITTATGNVDSTVLEHPLKLKSTYTEVVGSTGTRDSNGEPLVTSYNTCFMGTVDYIWRSEGLCTAKVLAPISKLAMQPSGGFPTKKWGSDHIALASELVFIKK
ncbi:carbon catabolite repressor protein 4 homolog 6 isoform X2 [Amaranthus tricolor]|uniref:carbon catabolite repressor protein 4 homolog 6 isoform X2 n=1 Tax=Amaranthus tricolor TaxID=29722 RepID=UPI00258E8138|nr:carbon catabolite repressor protein 4 homolog 6 isoform X2 [Amaranthus tricolor]